MKKTIFKVFLTLSLIITIAFALGQTGAWFTHTAEVENVTITLGAPVILTIEGVYGKETVVPGDELQNFVQAYAKAADEASSMYVRAKITTEEPLNAFVQVISAGTNWVECGDYFYYTDKVNTLTNDSKLNDLKILNKAESTSNLNIDIIVLNTATEETLNPGTVITFNIVFQAIQSANTKDYSILEMNNEWGKTTQNEGSQEVLN